MKNQHRKTVHLSYFSFLRESRGASEESLKTEASTAGDLYAELQNRYGFCLSRDSLKVAVNDTFSSWKTELKTGDRIVFIPPVSGG
jgi:molybdopterin converting factor subunit 1